MIAREGSIVDASFVDAPRQRNRREDSFLIKEGERPEGFDPDTAKGRQKDCDALWTKKNAETHSYTLYKNHAKVDARSKLVVGYKRTCSQRAFTVTQVLKDLIDEQDEAVFADNAYQSESSDKLLIENDCQNFILFKARRNDTQALPRKSQQINCAVESDGALHFLIFKADDG